MQKFIAQNAEFKAAVNQEIAPGKGRGSQGKPLQHLTAGLKIAGFLEVSQDILRKAKAEALKAQRKKVAESFSLIKPFLQLFKLQNPGFIYDVGQSASGELEDICVLMPYCNHGLQHGYELLGLDGGHQKEVIVDISADGKHEFIT